MRLRVSAARWAAASVVMVAGTIIAGVPAQADAFESYLAETYPAKGQASWSVRAERAASLEPYSGTMWISPSVLTPNDPTDLQSVEYVGIEQRRTFDRRSNRWLVADAHIIRARYACGLTLVDVVVNVEFSQEQALNEAERFAEVLGRIPPGLRYAVDELWIHGGNEPAGGGNRSVLIHVDSALEHWAFVEELFLHEAAHTTLDYEVHGAGVIDRASWEAAKAQDGRYISDYARDFPAREDVAESYVAFALAKAAQMASPLDRDAQIIAATIPSRLAYLETLGEEFVPRTDACPVIAPQALTNLKAVTRGKFTTVSWTPPTSLWGISHYEWRVGSRSNVWGGWQSFGDRKSASLILQNSVRGKSWIVEVRAVWGSEPGPAMSVRYKS